jgi:UDP-N-acetylmuramate--alanine ligase
MRRFGHRNANYAASNDAAIAHVVADAKPGDMILTLGAGNVSQAGQLLLDALAS